MMNKKDTRPRKTERRYKRITYTQRLKLETLYNSGLYTVKRIAFEIGKTPQAVYLELNKGLYQTYTGDYYKVTRYSADRAQQKANFAQSAGGSQLKLGNDYAYISLIERLILKEKLSPYAALHYIEENHIPTKTHISVTTLYSYINMGLFPNITNAELWYRRNRKQKKQNVRIIRQSPRGTSIELRPENIDTRKEFGHWELDSVIGKNEKGKTLLSLTERKTRNQFILKSNDKSGKSTLQAIARLRRVYGKKWDDIFRTITVDNGSEFFALANAHLGSTKIFYCHPYCPSERCSNENQNRIIRRFIIKGTKIEQYSDKYIQLVERYMNNLPRKILHGKSSKQAFSDELQNLYEKNGKKIQK